jgi:acyl dehydratase
MESVRVQPHSGNPEQGEHSLKHLDVKLGRRTYSLTDQERFAEFSGDFNPLHLDPVEARRELLGDVAGHEILPRTRWASPG